MAEKITVETSFNSLGELSKEKIEKLLNPIKEIIKDKTEVFQLETVKSALKNGFKIDEFISGTETAYCPTCKGMKQITGSYKMKHKNNVNFVRGSCATCGTDCWKSV